MRIISGAWRGRALIAPQGDDTRPTADRVRQALFDRLLHAPWAGPAMVVGAAVLDAFAGTGALGLEALSRGASSAVFIEQNRGALAALRSNIATCDAGKRARVLVADALRPPPGRQAGLVFLDPPYGQGLVERATAALTQAGWIGPGTLLVAELGRDDALPAVSPLADWAHGAACMVAWRA